MILWVSWFLMLKIFPTKWWLKGSKKNGRYEVLLIVFHERDYHMNIRRQRRYWHFKVGQVLLCFLSCCKKGEKGPRSLIGLSKHSEGDKIIENKWFILT